MLNLIKKSVFSRNVLALASGTTFAQVIPILASPWLTRIYTPEAFGEFAIYLAITSILSIIIAARYELAIMLPDHDSDAIQLLFLSIIIACIFSIILQIFLFFIPIKQFIFFLLPLSVLIAGISQAFIYWNNRNSKFTTTSKTKIYNSLSMVLFQIVIGIGFYDSSGLIIGFIIGQIVGLGVLFYYQTLFSEKYAFNISRIKSLAYDHRDKPFLSIWGGLMDSIAYQLPTFAVASFFGAYSAGLYNLAAKIINTPLNLIGIAIGQVAFQHIAKTQRDNPNQLSFFLKKTTFNILLFSAPLFVFLFFTAEYFFVLVFGEPWRDAGKYAALMSMPAMVRIAANPISSVFFLKEYTNIGVLWQLSHFLSISSGVFTLYFLNKSLWDFTITIVIIDFLLYTLYILLAFKVTKNI